MTATHSLGGVPLYVDLLARDQLARGWEPIVGCPKGGSLSQLLPLGIPKVPWPDSSRPDDLVRAAAHLRRMVDGFEPDIVHLHASVAGAIGRMVVRGSTPTIFQPHAWSFYSVPERLRPSTELLERQLSRWSASTLCGSPGELDVGSEHGIRALTLIDNAVDTERFVPADGETRAQLRRHFVIDTGLAVVSVGRMESQKNHRMMLDAWRLADPRDATLLPVGDGHLRRDLEATMPDNARFIDTMNDPLAAHQVADLTLLTSRYETRSLATLEAMACGSPVLGTVVSGAEHIERSGAGEIIAQGDTADFARAIAEWVADRDRLAVVRPAARASVTPDFALPSWTTAMADLYERLA